MVKSPSVFRNTELEWVMQNVFAHHEWLWRWLKTEGGSGRRENIFPTPQVSLLSHAEWSDLPRRFEKEKERKS